MCWYHKLRICCSLKLYWRFIQRKKKEISKVTPKMYPDQEGRALGSLILKIHNLKDFSLSNFFYSCVAAVNDYCSGV